MPMAGFDDKTRTLGRIPRATSATIDRASRRTRRGANRLVHSVRQRPLRYVGGAILAGGAIAASVALAHYVRRRRAERARSRAERMATPHDEAGAAMHTDRAVQAEEASIVQP
jgi:hypothetical protein